MTFTATHTQVQPAHPHQAVEVPRPYLRIVLVLLLVVLSTAGGAWWQLLHRDVPSEQKLAVAPLSSEQSATTPSSTLAVPLDVPLEPQPKVARTVEPAPSVPSLSTKRILKHPKTTAPLRIGYLTADASPWAEVLLKGKSLEHTPFVRYPLPTGKHTLVFRGPGGITQSRTVIVKEGAVTAVRVEFDAPESR